MVSYEERDVLVPWWNTEQMAAWGRGCAWGDTDQCWVHRVS